MLESARIFLGKENVVDIAELISPLSEKIPSEQLGEQKFEILETIKDFSFIHDPYGFLLPHQFPDFEKVVILRDPAKRYLSYLNMVVNYDEHDLKVAPQRSLSEYNTLLHLSDDDVETAQNLLPMTFLKEFFQRCHRDYHLNLDHLDRIFFLEHFSEFENWFISWSKTSRKKLLTFNEGTNKRPKRLQKTQFKSMRKKSQNLKKFRDFNKVSVPNEMQQLHIHALMLNRRPELVSGDIQVREPLMNDPDMGKHADVYGKEDNPYGPAHCLGPHELVYIPCPQGQLFSLFASKPKILQFKVANMAHPNVLNELDGFVLLCSDGKSRSINLAYEYSSAVAPFTISFKAEKADISDFQNSGHIFFFIKHKPTKLNDGSRRSSVQLSGGIFTDQTP